MKSVVVTASLQVARREVSPDLYQVLPSDLDPVLRRVYAARQVQPGELRASLRDLQPVSSFRGALRAYSECHCGTDDLLETVRRLNKMACAECAAGEFISLFYGVIDVEKKTITYCNCGHEPPALYRDKHIADLNKGGLVLGVLPNAEYQSEIVQLKARKLHHHHVARRDLRKPADERAADIAAQVHVSAGRLQHPMLRFQSRFEQRRIRLGIAEITRFKRCTSAAAMASEERLRAPKATASAAGPRDEDESTRTSPLDDEEPIPMREPQNPGQSAAYYPAGGPRRKARKSLPQRPAEPLDSPQAGSLTFRPLMRGGAAW